MPSPDLKPLLLDPANFTPRSRTPWGGPRLPALKAPHVTGEIDARIGESWEISVEPDFPSRVAGGPLLADVIARAPEAWLGEGRAMELLVKLLDAAAPLSVQIHPHDGDPALAPDESGKPEAWYVVDHEEGAGVFLGLEEGVDEVTLRSAIERGDDVSGLLRFHPVEKGDFFLVEPGVPHAVGAGVFLVEPQRVQPGRRGITYRYWDWNRRYDDRGRESPDGRPRELHLERALAVTDFSRPRGEEFDRQVKRSLGAPSPGDVRFEPLAGFEGGIASSDLLVARISGSGVTRLPSLGTLIGITVVRGSVASLGEDVTLVDGELRGERVIGAGRSAVFPAELGEHSLFLSNAEAIVSAIPPRTK